MTSGCASGSGVRRSWLLSACDAPMADGPPLVIGWGRSGAGFWLCAWLSVRQLPWWWLSVCGAAMADGGPGPGCQLQKIRKQDRWVCVGLGLGLGGGFELG